MLIQLTGSEMRLVVLLFLICYAVSGCWAQANLTSIIASPCGETFTNNVSLYSSDIFTVLANFSDCPEKRKNGTTAFRVFTYAVASTKNPVVFTARERTGVVPWTIPLQPEGFKSTFQHVNRTLCAGDLTDSNETLDTSPLFYVDVFSSSSESVSYNISFEPVESFSLQLYTQSSVVVGAASPQILYFKFPAGIDEVTVQANSESSRCAIVSVQNNTCPANDLLENARSKGAFQTMSTDAFLTIRDDQVTKREFLLVLIATNFSVCHGSNYKPLAVLKPPNDTDVPEDQFEQTINVTIRTPPPISEYRLAVAFPVLLFLAVYLVGLPLFLLTSRIPPFHIPAPKCTRSRSCQCCKRSSHQTVGSEGHNSDTVHLTCCAEKTEENETLVPTTPQNYGTANVNVDTEAPAARGLEDSSLEISAMHKPEIALKLPQMMKTGYRKLKQHYTVYSWNTITVGIFYALPAFQLVLSEQQILYVTGNEDRCYYNFKCARPTSIISAFNNVWSNFGYVALGWLFFIIVCIRHYQFDRKREKDKKENKEIYVDTHGVPQFFGIYYAMAVALFLEGCMSAFYHICPTNANFQFDTAFMFIIGGLFLVKIFQNRHPDVHANAFIAFFSFAVVILFTLLGIRFDKQNPLAVRLTLFTIVMLLVVIFFLSFYHFHHWTFVSMCRSIRDKIKFICSHRPREWACAPVHRVRFAKLVVATVINLFLTVIVIIAYKSITIATGVLAFFLVNVIYFLFCYVLQKWWYGEPWTILPIVFLGAVAILWGGAFYFYFSAVTNWQKTPAESRQLNKPCILLGFYDNHDVWHFLSASAMFFSFLFVLTLDDGLANTRRDDIQVF